MAASSAAYTLLIIDDAAPVRDATADMLRLVGYDVLTAENGADGLAILQQQPVDLILLDTNMPVMDGPATLRAIRARQLDVPVIIASTDSQGKIASRYDVTPFPPYLHKPFDVSHLLQMIDALLTSANV